MKLKELESHLSTLECDFPSPKIALEQYPTSAHLAARMLFVASTTYDDIEGMNVLDLGCGTGILSIGSALLDANYVLGVDCDADAVSVAQANATTQEIDVEFALAQIPTIFEGRFDTVVMNPPFGTRKEGIDWLFIETALKHADVVYSLHKTSTRKYLLEKASRDFGSKSEVIAELKFQLPKSYKFHKKESLDIAVDLLRFEKL